MENKISVPERSSLERGLVQKISETKKYQEKRINGVKTYKSEDDALSLQPGQWEKIENEFRSRDSQFDTKESKFIHDINKNFSNDVTARIVDVNIKDAGTETKMKLLIRRRIVETTNGETTITEAFKIPEDNAKLTQVVFRIARNEDKVVNLMDIIPDESKENVHLKFRSNLPPLPNVLKDYLIAKWPHLDEGSMATFNGRLIQDESANKKIIKGKGQIPADLNELMFMHESGHLNQKIWIDYILQSEPNIVLLTTSDRMSFYRTKKVLEERNAWEMAVSVMKKYEELGVPIVSGQLTDTLRASKIQGFLSHHNADDDSIKNGNVFHEFKVISRRIQNDFRFM